MRDANILHLPLRTNPCPLKAASLQRFKIYIGMEGAGLRTEITPSLCSFRFASLRLNYLKRDFRLCLSSLAGRCRLLLCVLFLCFCSITAESAYRRRDTPPSDAVAAQRPSPHNLFKRSFKNFGSSRGDANANPVQGCRFSLLHSPALQDASADLTYRGGYGHNDKSALRRTNEVSNVAGYSTAAARSEFYAPTQQDDAGASATNKWQQRATRSWRRFKKIFKRKKLKDASRQTEEQTSSHSPPPPPATALALGSMETDASAGGHEATIADTAIQLGTGALSEQTSRLIRDTRRDGVPFPPASQASFRKYVAQVPSQIKEIILKWIPEVTPQSSSSSDVRELQLQRQVVALTPVDEEILYGPRITTRWRHPVWISSPNKKRGHTYDPEIVGKPIHVRSTLSKAVYVLTLQERLGSGGEGIIFAAESGPSPSTRVAVKIFVKNKRTQGRSPEDWFISKLFREGAPLYNMPVNRKSPAASRLMHLVLPLDFVYPADSTLCPKPVGDATYSCIWIVMQLFSSNLDAMLKDYILTPEQRISVSRQMIMSVMMVHSMNLIHNDIKLTNFLVSHDGRVYLGDFGLTAPMDRTSRTGMGTVAFMAPERLDCIAQKTNSMQMTRKLDSWSLGISLYLLWCNRKHPFVSMPPSRRDDFSRNNVTRYMISTRLFPLDFRDCRPGVPRAVAEAIAALLDVDEATRATPWDLYSRFAIFNQSIFEILKEDDTSSGIRVSVV